MPTPAPTHPPRSLGTMLGFWGSLLLACCAAIHVVWNTDLPLGIPGEWVWPRIESPEPFVWRLVIPALVGLIYLGFVWRAGEAAEAWSTSRLAVNLAILVGLGFVWLGSLQQACPEGYDLGKSAWVLYYPKSSGYFTEARAHQHDLPDYLAHYEEVVAEGDVLHQGTHPPGLILAFSALLRTVERWPALILLLRETEPASVSRSFDELQALSRQSPAGGGAGAPLTPADRAVLWWALLLVQAGAALTVVPLYDLARRTTQSRTSAFLAAALWPVVPALAMFIPKSDALFPLWTCGLTWTALRAASSPPRRACGWGLLTGMLFALGMLLSLAMLACGCCATLAAVVLRRQQGRPVLDPASLSALGGAVVGFGGTTALLGKSLGCSLPTIWWWNYRNHAGFYAQYPRTWWKWLAEGPVELAWAAGLPLAWGACAEAVHRVRERSWSSPLAAFGFTWGVLWLTGKNRGEAARLWLFLIPLLCWITAHLLERLPAEQRLRTGVALLALQMIIAAGIVLRVGGFEY
ncbi:MAG: hypothetical protein ACK5UC_13095 [Planctomycetaceae bacterium]|jgi:hypothetical protein